MSNFVDIGFFLCFMTGGIFGYEIPPITTLALNGLSDNAVLITPGLGEECTKDLLAIQFGLDSRHNASAKLLIDSWGKPPSGLNLVSLTWPGSYSECKSLKVSYNVSYYMVGEFTGQYHIASVTMSTASLYPENAANVTFRYGYCLPDSCDADAFLYIFECFKEYLHIPESYEETFSELIDYGNFAEVPYEINWDWRGILALVSGLFLLSMVVIATVIDIRQRYTFYAETNETESLISPIGSQKEAVLEAGEVQPKRTPPVFYSSRDQCLSCRILMCFSAYTNGENALSTKGSAKNIDCVNGIRFISMTWVVLIHAFAYAVPFLDNLKMFGKITETLSYQVILSGDLAVDTFFLLSGTFASYSFMSRLQDDGSLIAKALKCIAHRFWRLTPVYMVILCLYVCLFRYLGSGPFWNANGREIDFCQDTWWTNLLYLNNFIRTNKMCMGWTWFLAVDMQLYIFSCFILVIIAKWKKSLLPVLCVCLGATFGISGYVFYSNDLIEAEKAVNFLTALGNPISSLYYIKPYTRYGPYIIGILLGQLFFKTKLKFEMKTVYVVSGWILSATLSLSLVYGRYEANMSDASIILYEVFSRTAWSVGIAWVIFACAHGYGGFINAFLSWKLFLPLSKLTYCTYLIHIPVIYYFYDTRITPINPVPSVLISYFLVSTFISYGVAFMLYVGLEVPMMNLESLITKPRRRQ